MDDFQRFGGTARVKAVALPSSLRIEEDVLQVDSMLSLKVRVPTVTESPSGMYSEAIEPEVSSVSIRLGKAPLPERPSSGDCDTAACAAGIRHRPAASASPPARVRAEAR